MHILDPYYVSKLIIDYLESNNFYQTTLAYKKECIWLNNDHAGNHNNFTMNETLYDILFSYSKLKKEHKRVKSLKGIINNVYTLVKKAKNDIEYFENTKEPQFCNNSSQYLCQNEKTIEDFRCNETSAINSDIHNTAYPIVTEWTQNNNPKDQNIYHISNIINPISSLNNLINTNCLINSVTSISSNQNAFLPAIFNNNVNSSIKNNSVSHALIHKNIIDKTNHIDSNNHKINKPNFNLKGELPKDFVTSIFKKSPQEWIKWPNLIQKLLEDSKFQNAFADVINKTLYSPNKKLTPLSINNTSTNKFENNDSIDNINPPNLSSNNGESLFLNLGNYVDTIRSQLNIIHTPVTKGYSPINENIVSNGKEDIAFVKQNDTNSKVENVIEDNFKPIFNDANDHKNDPDNQNTSISSLNKDVISDILDVMETDPDFESLFNIFNTKDCLTDDVANSFLNFDPSNMFPNNLYDELISPCKNNFVAYSLANFESVKPATPLSTSTRLNKNSFTDHIAAGKIVPPTNDLHQIKAEKNGLQRFETINQSDLMNLINPNTPLHSQSLNSLMIAPLTFNNTPLVANLSGNVPKSFKSKLPLKRNKGVAANLKNDKYKEELQGLIQLRLDNMRKILPKESAPPFQIHLNNMRKILPKGSAPPYTSAQISNTSIYPTNHFANISCDVTTLVDESKSRVNKTTSYKNECRDDHIDKLTTNPDSVLPIQNEEEREVLNFLISLSSKNMDKTRDFSGDDGLGNVNQEIKVPSNACRKENFKHLLEPDFEETKIGNTNHSHAKRKKKRDGKKILSRLADSEIDWFLNKIHS
ncbi:unnamed protein product [Gordionus sp. m RMFG-2023]|uniref:homeobox protein 4-like n=1 Tax=Gordionus sp. m RMFG-2023 TaxID=3053472 RepID=UPI0030E417D4